MAILIIFFFVFFFFKQKTAYEMSIGDWSSDVCSSDLFFPPNLAPISGRKFPAQSCTCEASRRNRSREKMHLSAISSCLGARAGTRHCTHSRNQTSQIFAG